MLAQRVSIRLVAWVAVTIAIGVLAYLIGHHDSSRVTVTGPGIADTSQSGGTAYVGAGEPLNRQPYGFAYLLPRDVAWSDATGAIHVGGHPSCLPLDRAVRVKQLEAVRFTIPGGATTGAVVWVQC